MLRRLLPEQSISGDFQEASGRLQLDFAMIEMDRTSAQVETLLTELADQGATALNLSERTAGRHWAFARAWLRQAMEGDKGA